jgi:L-serine dehydratase
METLQNLYRIGHGPSSSHTLGPAAAAKRFLAENTRAHRFRVTLYGSLAATGMGHGTDAVIRKAFGKKECEILWEPGVFHERHPNSMRFESLSAAGNTLRSWMAYSVGGGAVVDDSGQEESAAIYPLHALSEILDYCGRKGLTLWQYVEEVEGAKIWPFLAGIWAAMDAAIKRGLAAEGVLPGGLNLQRKASSYIRKASQYRDSFKKNAALYAYALAVSEENAAGGIIVTAPTCGSSGVLPAVLKYMRRFGGSGDEDMLRALATAGLIGNLVKRNASISGAEVGCQGEVGTACAMASAAATQLYGGTNYQIEYAAEMGLEHHLGLTCDPVAGLVQIPCIERNALAAARALSHSTFALLSDGRHLISFDRAVMAMKQTGRDLPGLYKETAEGGLALFGKDLVERG